MLTVRVGYTDMLHELRAPCICITLAAQCGKRRGNCNSRNGAVCAANTSQRQRVCAASHGSVHRAPRFAVPPLPERRAQPPPLVLIEVLPQQARPRQETARPTLLAVLLPPLLDPTAPECWPSGLPEGLLYPAPVVAQRDGAMCCHICRNPSHHA